MLIVDMDTPIYMASGAAQKKAPDGSIVTEPEHYAFHNVNVFLEGIFKKFPDHDYHLYLTTSPDKHYRYDLYPEYKGHRKKLEKPVHYKATREYVLKNYQSSVVEGMEADDAVAIAMGFRQVRQEAPITSNTPIAVYIDKDIHQVPGWRYQYNKKIEE